MPSFSPSRLLVAAVISLAVVLSGWYGFRTASRDQALQVSRNSPSLSSAVEASDAPSKERGEKEESEPVEVAALREAIDLLKSEIAALHSQAKAQADQLSILRHQFKRQAEQLSGLREASERSQAPLGREMDSSASEESTDPAAAQAQEAALMQEEQEHSLKRAQANEREFSAQAVDTIWANEADGLLQETFASTEFQDTRLSGVQCRATLCRVEVAHENRDQRFQFEQHFPLMVTAFPNIAVHTTENNDGSSSTLMYLAREGYPLPQDALSRSQ